MAEEPQTELVALDATGDDMFVTRLQQLWADGCAVAPIDPRLGAPARQRVMDRLSPTAELAADGQLTTCRNGRPVASGDALVMTTSGTSGEPKGVIITHAALAASARATNDRLGIDPRADRWLACLPMSHMGGLGVVIRALANGTPLTMAHKPDVDSITAGLAHGCTRTALVATVLTRVDTSGFSTVLVGGGPAPQGVADNVIATYGLTESAGGVVYDGWPLDGVDVNVVDGVICLRGPMLARAYRLGSSAVDSGPPAPSDAALTDSGGWFSTGDAGHIDPDGRLHVLGRVGDMIITGGEKVWPAAVEPILASHPDVAEVAVVGRPDPEWGQAVVAVVVPTDPARPPDIGALRNHVRDHLEPWAAPRRLELVSSLPRTALGKVVRSSLGAPPAG